jgi:hypothetical protein
LPLNLKSREMISDFPQVMTQVRRSFPALVAWLLIAGNGGAQRINPEGRILGPAPVVSSPILFNTAEADAIVSAMQIIPITNPWNEDISQRPRLANSDAMIAQIKNDLSPTRQTLRAFYGANDNWKDWQKNAIQSIGLAPANAAESALLVELAPGNCTAIVSGVGGATGVGLVEANHLP